MGSPRARTKIRQWFSKERREEAIERGKDQLTRALRKHHLPLQRTVTSEALLAVAQDFNRGDVAALYEAIGSDAVGAHQVVDKLLQHLGGAEGTEEDLAETTRVTHPVRPGVLDAGVLVQGASDVYVKIARCCTPVPPDEIVGFVTRGSGISVHRKDCANMRVIPEDDDRIKDVSWAPTQSSLFLVEIQVEALDRKSLLYDVTKALWSDKTRAALDSGHAKGKSIVKQTALAGIAVPLHPGAERFYKEAGLLT